jgi:type II secretory pathway pseudopilin PulG
MNITRNRQRGATLLVVLVMLVVITLLGIAGIRMSTSSLTVVGNMQARKFTENHAQLAVEAVMNNIAPFNSPTGAITTSAGTGTDPMVIYSVPSGVGITVSDRTCIYSAAASGYSAVSSIAPEDNIWEYKVSVADSFTGAATKITQGAKIRQLSGSCI